MTDPLDSANFEILDGLGGPAARIRFRGPFAGAEIEWTAEVVTLAHAYANDSAEHGTRRRRGRCFIEMAAPYGARATLRIGLAVAAIDRGTLLKTVIMIRRWKNLAPGRHEYGEPVDLTRSDAG